MAGQNENGMDSSFKSTKRKPNIEVSRDHEVTKLEVSHGVLSLKRNVHHNFYQINILPNFKFVLPKPVKHCSEDPLLSFNVDVFD